MALQFELQQIMRTTRRTNNYHIQARISFAVSLSLYALCRTTSYVQICKHTHTNTQFIEWQITLHFAHGFANARAQTHTAHWSKHFRINWIPPSGVRFLEHGENIVKRNKTTYAHTHSPTTTQTPEPEYLCGERNVAAGGLVASFVRRRRRVCFCGRHDECVQ